MMTFSFASFFSTNVLISSKAQIRLFGTWFSALPEYHRMPPTLPFLQAAATAGIEGAGRTATAALITETVLLAAQAVTGEADIRGDMRRSATR
jgi:hypothetical protein